ncbi:MAG TPA: NYN domain-containing protein [Acidimicrobiales bacterium]|nr:NYN domain-containing protein [Acidimicrobiales bacterium]
MRPADRPWQALIEPALILALAVAKASEHPDDVPRVLRPVLGFAKWNARAFDIARRALDADEAFRARVADAVADDDPDLHPSWLFLHRPDGWKEELTSLAEAATTRAAQDELEREERVAVQRLRSVEDARDKADQGRRDAEAATRTAEEKLVAERRARQAATADAKAARKEMGEVRASLSAAEREVAEAREREVKAQALVARLREQMAAVKADLASARREAKAEVALPPPPAPEAPEKPDRVGVVADPAVARAIADAAQGAQRLAEALSTAAAALAPVAARTIESSAAHEQDVPGTPPEAVAVARARTNRPPSEARPRRRPTALPPATFEDSPEAAEHLVRVRGALLLVDGYNAAFATRPGASVAERRGRIIDALGELSARTGITVHAIFDGSDDAMRLASPSSPEGVRVSFTTSDVEADDVILDLVDRIPFNRPVIVATSDRRVQSGARQRGANVISTAQLYGVLRRER